MSAFIMRVALSVFAIVLIVAGLIVLPLPIPFGAAMILVGVAILISSNDTAAGWVRNLRIRNPGLNRRMLTLQDRLPGKLGEIIRRTAP